MPSLLEYITLRDVDSIRCPVLAEAVVHSRTLTLLLYELWIEMSVKNAVPFRYPLYKEVGYSFLPDDSCRCCERMWLSLLKTIFCSFSKDVILQREAMVIHRLLFMEFVDESN